MCKNKLLIVGASGHGKVVADIAMKMNKWIEISFLDDNKSLAMSIGLKVIGTSKEALNFVDEYDLFVAVGNNVTREKNLNNLLLNGASIPILIHPSAVIGTDVTIGIGSVIMAGAIINCCTSIGIGCIINTGATVDHDNTIEDFVHISPGVHVAGAVHIGKNSWLGIGSKVINSISIAENCMVGAGGVVINNIELSGVYIGIPAKNVNI